MTVNHGDWVRCFVSSGDTKKEDVVKGLVNIVKKRYEKSRIKLTKEVVDKIYFDLLGCYEREGFEAAKFRAENTKLRRHKDEI